MNAQEQFDHILQRSTFMAQCVPVPMREDLMVTILVNAVIEAAAVAIKHGKRDEACELIVESATRLQAMQDERIASDPNAARILAGLEQRAQGIDVPLFDMLPTPEG